MAYPARVEALRRRFGQETDPSIALQELAGLKRGRNQSAKELADSARGLASRAYYSNDYASQEKAALHAFQMVVGEELQLKCALEIYRNDIQNKPCGLCVLKNLM